MKVRFDSLDRFEVPNFFVCSPGSQYKSGMLTKVLGCLSDTSDEELVVNFNAMSELNFRINRIKREDPEENAYTTMLYNALQNRRLIFVEDIGYFSVSDVEDNYSDGVHYKDVRAQSIESEIQNKLLPYIEDGAYLFTDLLEKIVAVLPMWTIGEVNGDVAKKYRTFQDVSIEQNALSFLQENMQDAYECIFEFDCINRQIIVHDQNNYIEETEIHLTKNDVINSLNISNASEDLYTALNVRGDENLNISPVNPLGTNVIYNFDYYLDWMSDELREKVVAWQQLVTEKESEYYDLNLQYYERLTEQSDLRSEVDRINTQIDMYQRCRSNIVASGSTSTVESYNEVIVENGGVPVGIQNELADTLTEIDSLIADAQVSLASVEAELEEIEAGYEDLLASIEAIHESVAITSYFSESEYDELSYYIYEGSYTDEYIAVTSSMTYAQKFEQMKTLYDRAVTKMTRISEPTHEFSLDVENFLFAKEFEQWSEQLKTGCLINVELDIGDVALLFLSNMTVNYEDKTLSMTFGNRFSRFDPKAIFNGVLGGIKKSTNSINYIKDILYPVKEGEFDAMKEAIESSGILTKNAALASVNQEILIDDTGILGRKLLEDGTYDPKQIKVTNQTIVFTDDGWETSRTGIGNFLFNNPLTGEVEEHYGVIADTLIGSLVLSEEVGIYNPSNSITLDRSGFTLTSDYTGDQPSKMVFTIQKKLLNEDGNPYYSKQLYIDDDGNLVLNGSISIYTSSGDSTNLEDLATSGGGGAVQQYLHIKYSDDCLTFTGNLLSTSIDKWVSGVVPSRDTIETEVSTTGYEHYLSFVDVISVEPGTVFNAVSNNDSIKVYIKQYDVDGNYVSSSELSTNLELTIPDDIHYLRVMLQGTAGTTTYDSFVEYFENGDIIPDMRDANAEAGIDTGLYIGTYIDGTEDDSLVFSDYEWTKFTEDVAEEIADLRNQLQTTTDSLSSTIQNNTNELYDTIQSESEKINNTIDDKIAGVNSSVTDQINSASSEIDKKYATIINDVNEQLTAHKAEVGQYMTFNDDGLTLGASSSKFKTVIDNTGLYFKQEDIIVSYVDNNQLHIPNAVIESTLILGNFFFSPREDGGVSLTWQE